MHIIRDKEHDWANTKPTGDRSVLEREAQDREGYLKKPQSPAESRLWEAETSWPEK